MTTTLSYLSDSDLLAQLERACAQERLATAQLVALLIHHVVPYAKGGPTTSENLELRCRTHNVYESEQKFPQRAQPLFARETGPDYGTRTLTRSGLSKQTRGVFA